MNAATPPRSPSAPAADGTVGFNVLCVRCGYNLRGLATNGMCPECAASVAESIRISRQGAVTPDAARLLADGAAWMALAAVVSMCSAMLPLEDVMRGVRLPLWKAGGTLVLAWVPAVAGWMGAMLVVSRAAMPTALGGAWNIARVLVMLLVTIGTGWWAVLAVADATGSGGPDARRCVTSPRISGGCERTVLAELDPSDAAKEKVPPAPANERVAPRFEPSERRPRAIAGQPVALAQIPLAQKRVSDASRTGPQLCA